MVALAVGGLLLVMLIGQLVNPAFGALGNTRFFLLAPTLILLLWDWHRVRRTVAQPDGAGAENSITNDLLTIENSLYRGAWIGACALVAIAVCDVVWARHPVWIHARSFAHVGPVLGVLWVVYEGVGAALHAAQSHLAQGQTLGSRDWASAVDESRDRAPATRLILDALDLGAGLRVGDVGAGGGYFALKIAERVGPTGLVVATDIESGLVTQLRQRATRLGLDQLTARHVEARHPILVSERLDRLLVCNVYLFDGAERPTRELMEQLAKALCPGGTLVVYNEFVHEAGWSPGAGWAPLAASQPDAAALCALASPWFERASEVALPAPRRALEPHERAGYLLVLRRRGR
jgi:SAM-dependent methyltransferase